MEVGRIELKDEGFSSEHHFLYEMEKQSHFRSNQMFLDLLHKIWNDEECLNHMSEEVFQEFKRYADSWGWT